MGERIYIFIGKVMCVTRLPAVPRSYYFGCFVDRHITNRMKVTSKQAEVSTAKATAASNLHTSTV